MKLFSAQAQCSANEVFALKGSECDCIGCASINQPKCVCKAGFIRNAQGQCVSKSTCGKLLHM